MLVDCLSLDKPPSSYRRPDVLSFSYTAGLLTLIKAQRAIEPIVDNAAADVTFSCYTIDNPLWAKVALGVVIRSSTSPGAGF